MGERLDPGGRRFATPQEPIHPDGSLYFSVTWRQILTVLATIGTVALTGYCGLASDIGHLDGRLDDVVERLAEVEGIVRGMLNAPTD